MVVFFNSFLFFAVFFVLFLYYWFVVFFVALFFYIPRLALHEKSFLLGFAWEGGRVYGV